METVRREICRRILTGVAQIVDTLVYLEHGFVYVKDASNIGLAPPWLRLVT